MRLYAFPLILVQVVLFAQAAYLFFLTLAGLFYRTPNRRSNPADTLRFAVLVPAHNEEQALPKLIESLRANDYPANLYELFVVADNCTDGTADVARTCGARVFERFDSRFIGKGYALQWLLGQLRTGDADYDAYVFLDADCEVSSNFFQVMAQRLAEGHPAVQAFYTSVQFSGSSVAVLRAVALTLKHHTRGRGRAALGLACGLFGTGMAFSRQVIQTHGWNAFTLAEDIEYQLQLADADTYVAFAPEAQVTSAMPASLAQANSQNLRWERGRLRLMARIGPRLALTAFRQRSLRKLDIVLEQSVPPLSVLAVLSALMVPVALASRVPLLVPLSLTTVTALAAHVFVGLRAARVPRTAYRAILFVPVFIMWKLFIYLTALLPGGSKWVRTKRDESHP